MLNTTALLTLLFTKPTEAIATYTSGQCDRITTTSLFTRIISYKQVASSLCVLCMYEKMLFRKLALAQQELNRRGMMYFNFAQNPSTVSYQYYSLHLDSFSLLFSSTIFFFSPFFIVLLLLFSFKKIYNNIIEIIGNKK